MLLVQNTTQLCMRYSKKRVLNTQPVLVAIEMTSRMSYTLGPVGHRLVGWVLAKGWQLYWATGAGAADEAVAWSPADGG
jgi:hypothetical protein